MTPAGIVAAVWIAIAIPVAVLVGRVIARGRRDDKHPPGDGSGE